MSKEAMKLALEALELVNLEFVCGNGSHHAKQDRHEWDEDCPITDRWRKAITSLREALAKPDFWEGYVPEPVKPAQQEPVAYLCENAVGHQYFRWKKPSSTYKPIALYTSPPAQRTWVGLTEDERDTILRSESSIFEMTEAILKAKNT